MSDSSGEDSDVAAVARTRPALFRDEAPSSSPPPRPIVSSRPARPQPRFLGDQDDDNDATDDLFGNLDNVPNHRVPARLNPNDFDDLFKAAEAPSLDALQGDDDVGGINVDGVAQKKRRTVAKMNDERLLGPTGFPKLLEDSKRFKSKGKGHEKQDLKRLMTMYQLWAHQMYPKTNLRDTLQTVEKLCHKRSVQRALKEYRDELKHGKRPPRDTLDIDAAPGPAAPVARDNAARGTTAAPVDADIDFDNLFADEDELLAELEMDAAVPVPRPAAAKEKQKSPSPLDGFEEEFGEGFDEDEEAMMRELHGMD